MLSSRPIHLPTDGHGYTRMATKTPGRENATQRPMTVHGKGKHNTAPVQPFSVQPQRTAKDKDAAFPAKNLTTRLITRPLGDKTPLPNRDVLDKFLTPLPGQEKLAKLVLQDTNRAQPALLHPADTPDSVARASSARKHIRAPRVSAGSTSFVTPLNNGNHWDVSELEVDVEVAAAPVEVSSPEDDYDEIEYMPPKLDTPYVPPFDFALPNYSEAGAALLRRAQSYPSSYDEDMPPPEIDPDACACQMPALSLPDIESDDPFLDGRTPSRPQASTAKTQTQVSARSRPPPASVSSRSGTRPTALQTKNARVPATSAPTAITRGTVKLPAPTKTTTLRTAAAAGATAAPTKARVATRVPATAASKPVAGPATTGKRPVTGAAPRTAASAGATGQKGATTGASAGARTAAAARRPLVPAPASARARVGASTTGAAGARRSAPSTSAGSSGSSTVTGTVVASPQEREDAGIVPLQMALGMADVGAEEEFLFDV